MAFPSPAGDQCRVVAPILARCDEPDLTEAERVLLSLHLVRCSDCQARLRDYRRQDRLLRSRPAISPSPQARQAVLDHIAGQTPDMGARPGPPLPGGLAGIAATAFLALFIGGVTLQGLPGSPPGDPSRAAEGHSARGEVLTNSLTGSLLTAYPTQVINNVSEVAQSTDGVAGRAAHYGVQATLLTGIVRAVYPAQGRIVLALDGPDNEQWLTLGRDAVIVLPDGRNGTLHDLAVGTAVRALCARPVDTSDSFDRAGPPLSIRELTVLR